jgi:peptidoglycan/xylan/chitin deacetylase (PgdA/CDA1 family)
LAAGATAFSLALSPATALARPLSGDPSIQITSPAAGATVTGVVEIGALTSQPAEAVLFEWSAGGIVWAPLTLDTDGSDGWTAQWDTSSLNGAMKLRASVQDPSWTAQTSLQVQVDNHAPTVRISMKNSVFSPNRDGRKDATKIVARAGEGGNLWIEIRDLDGKILRRFDLGWQGDGRASVRWSGVAGGRRLSDGRYRVVAIARDRVGLEDRTATSVVVDTRRPRVRIRRLGPDPSSGGLHRVRYRVRDRARRLHYRLVLSDHSSAIRKKTWRDGPGRGRTSVAPRYESGALFLPGRYTSRLVVTDDAGNVGRTRQRPWRLYRNAGAKVYTRLPAAGNKVAITLDDCLWDWGGALRALKSRDVKATFFCPGDIVAREPELARRTLSHGHAIGSHGWDHEMLTSVSYSQVRDRLLRDRAVWGRYRRNTSVPYMRPPYGGYDSTVVSAAAATGHSRIIMWDVDSLDYTGLSPSTITRRVVSAAGGGSILLLHTKVTTAKALPAIIDGLRRKGLQPVTVPQLFRAAGLR